ncbi:MAG TPA: hypothetical protein VKT27_14245 [Candidatus Binataceae bacterium]|nr:hypothetical protein [Candidatus Binataceae bacterium]
MTGDKKPIFPFPARSRPAIDSICSTISTSDDFMPAPAPAVDGPKRN